MNRIFVTGNAGSGKSTLAKELAKRKGIPFFSLDKIVWQENWQKTPKEERQKKIAGLLKKKSWVIDGVDYDILRAADTVIFLDIPRKISFYRVIKRNSRYLFSSRPDLPPNCPEILIIPTLVKIIWRFPGKVRPNILAEKNLRNDNSFVHITHKSQLEDYLAEL